MQGEQTIPQRDLEPGFYYIEDNDPSLLMEVLEDGQGVLTNLYVSH